jgi:hypothetical protein
LNALAHLHYPENINGFRVSGVDKQASANALKKVFLDLALYMNLAIATFNLFTLCAVCQYVVMSVSRYGAGKTRKDKTSQVKLLATKAGRYASFKKKN